MSLTLAPALQSWPRLPGNAVFNAAVVVVLTWIVMPLITRVLHRWLQPPT